MQKESAASYLPGINTAPSAYSDLSFVLFLLTVTTFNNTIEMSDLLPAPVPLSAPVATDQM